MRRRAILIAVPSLAMMLFFRSLSFGVWWFAVLNTASVWVALTRLTTFAQTTQLAEEYIISQSS